MGMGNYKDLIAKKAMQSIDSGFIIETLNPLMFDFQSDIVKWALRKGKAAIFADCGLGKTLMQLEWASQVYNYTCENVFIVAPLAVTKQTKSEGEKFNIHVNICRKQADVKQGINITNYEMLSHFDLSQFIGIVLDESSIIKSFSGATRNHIIQNLFRNYEIF